MATFNQCIRVISLVLTLSACGGGAGDTDTVDTGTGDTGSDIPNDQNINSGLSGRVYANERNEGWIVDLSSGNASQLPDKRWWDTGDYTGSGIVFFVYPNQDASEFLLFVDNCFRGFNGSGGDFDCLSIINAAGDLVTARGVISDGVREASLSVNGNYIAIIYADESYYDPSARLLIYDRSFTNAISESTMRATGGGQDSRFYARGLDWSQNGQLAYAYTKSIFLTSPYSTEGVPILTLPDSDSPMVDVYPVPANPRFSPDGSKIAFQISSGAGSTIWIMNIDGTDLHQLAHDNMSFNRVAWSPDGKYILTGLGGTTLDPIAGGVSELLYAIPSDSRDVPVPFQCDGEDADIAHATGIICVRTYFKSTQYLTRSFDPWGSYEWVE
jgi:WD40 repeat protein